MDRSVVRCTCAALLIAGVGVANARDIYVATNGNDGNAGTSASAALKTFAAAVNAAQPGDTVWISPGQYSESLVPTHSGTSTQPITFKRLGQGSAVIVAPSAQLTAIYINNVTDIVVDGIDANGGTPAPNATMGSFVTVENSTRITIQNGTYANANGWWGIGVQNNASYVVIQNNSVDMVGQFLSPKTQGGSGEGILAQYYNANHVLVQGNRVTHCGHDLLSLGSQFNIAQNNYLNNDWTDINGTPSGYRNVVVVGNNNVFQKNFLTHSGPGPAKYVRTTMLRVEGSSNIVRQNVLTNGYDDAFQSAAGSWTANGSGNHIYNNTAYQMGGPAWAMQISEPGYTRGNDVFQNNMAVNMRIAPPDYDNDIVFYVQTEALGPTSGSSVISNIILSAGGKTPTVFLGPHPGTVPLATPGSASNLVFGNLTTAQPKFISPAAPNASGSATSFAAAASAAMGNFGLQTGSPGVDQGAFLTTTTKAGSSSTLPVKDASFFIDGFGLIPGDMVKLQGAAQAVQVMHVDYQSNTLTLAQSVTFSAGQGLALDYQGSAPDIGAIESNNNVIAPLPPTNIQANRK